MTLGLASLRSRRLPLVVTALLGAVILLPLMLPDEPGTVHARRRYGKGGHYGPKCYGKQLKYISKCKSGCKGKTSIIKGCAAQGAKAALGECINTFKGVRQDCAGDGSCKAEARAGFTACKAEVKRQLRADIRAIGRRGYGGPACTRCCQKTCGKGSCTNYFSSSRWYASYKYRNRLRCVSSPSGAFAPGMTDAAREWLVKLVPFLVDGWSH